MERYRVLAAVVTILVVSWVIACAAGGTPAASIQAPPRLHVLIARETPVGPVLRRGPSRAA